MPPTCGRTPGTPLANYYAQHYGWGEKSDVFALVHQARSLADEISFAHFNHPTINLNLVAGLAGAVFLAWAVASAGQAGPRNLAGGGGVDRRRSGC